MTVVVGKRWRGTLAESRQDARHAPTARLACRRLLSITSSGLPTSAEEEDGHKNHCCLKTRRSKSVRMGCASWWLLKKGELLRKKTRQRSLLPLPLYAAHVLLRTCTSRVSFFADLLKSIQHLPVLMRIILCHHFIRLLDSDKSGITAQDCHRISNSQRCQFDVMQCDFRSLSSRT